MPNWRAYLLKHAKRARQDALLPAANAAVSEAWVWGRSNLLRPYWRRRERPIWADDWDLCVVLDATRFDQWAEVVADYDWLYARDWNRVRQAAEWSVGSASPEWYAKTFDPSVTPEERIGVVTANPFAAKTADRLSELDNTPLHENPVVDHVDYVFEDSWGCEVDGGYLDVTHPGAVTERAWDAWRDWDVDRLVVHYMQPHLPFRSKPDWFGRRENLDHFGEPELPDSLLGGDNDYSSNGNKEIWKEVRDGDRDYDAVWDAYCDNLRWGLDHVDRLRRAVEGQILITSDHGNALGERGLWSHPPGMQVAALRRVPWVQIRGRGQGELAPSDYTAYRVGERPAPNDVNAQLRALGYVEAGG